MPDHVWTLRILGSFELKRGEEVVDAFGARRDEQLLAVLAVDSPVLLGRDEIAARLWPDAELDAGRQNVSFNLFNLRKRLRALGIDEPVEEVRKRLRLSPEIDVDARRFTGLLARAATSSSTSERIWMLHEALAMYGGGLLPGLSSPWLDDVRQRFDGLYQDAARLLASLTQADPVMGDLIQRLPPTAWSYELGSQPTDASGEAAAPASEEDHDALLSVLDQAAELLASGKVDEAFRILSERESGAVAEIQRLRAEGQHEHVVRLLNATWRYWARSERGDIAAAELVAVLEEAPSLPEELQADAQLTAGILLSSHGRHSEAVPQLDAAHAFWTERDRPYQVMRTHLNRGRSHHALGDYGAAGIDYEHALRIARELENERAVLAALRGGALSAIRRGDAPLAQRLLLERSQRLKDHGAGNPSEMGDTLNNLTASYMLEGDYASAEATVQEAHELLRGTDLHDARVHNTMLRGRIEYMRGDLKAAMVHLEEAVALARAGTSQWMLGCAMGYLGVAYEVARDERAGQTLWDAIATLQAAGRRSEVAAFRQELREFRSWAEGEAPPRPA